MDTQLSDKLMQLDKYFVSANNVSVERANVPASEWKAFRALLDSLMLEYCPEEMSAEQLDYWAACQIPVR